MNHLHREFAPITAAAWAAIDGAAKEALPVYLAARKVTGFSGPHGWTKSSVPTGRVRAVAAPSEGVEARLRLVQPLMELRVPFSLERAELETIDRGNPNPALDAVVEAAKRIAAAEDEVVFMGHDEACVVGIATGNGHEPVALSDDFLAYPESVVTALQRLHDAGIGGPFALVLGPRCLRGLMTTLAEGGYPIYEHIKRLVDGPIVHAPGLSGALLLTMDEEAFELVVGEDLSIGYSHHDAERVHLYFEESLTFQLREPDGAVWLKYA